MKEIIQMIVVLSLISGVCALALSGFRAATAERIEDQVLQNVQGPKVKLVLDKAENDIINDRKTISVNGEDVLLFVGKKGTETWAIAYESKGGGFGGDIKVMVGYDIGNDTLTGIQVISHKETPGIGSKIAEDQFTKSFKGLTTSTRFTTKPQGGDVDAISGATYSARGVCEAIRNSVEIYPQVKKQMQAQ